MKSSVLVVLAVLVASTCASYVGPYRHYYVPGFQHTPHGIVSAYRNDLRQVHVNHVADYIGSGIGTGRFYGVPGTGRHFGYYGYGYGHPH